MNPPLISLIIPTLNEADNLPELCRRIAAALPGRPYEILLIDDASTDHTPAVAARLALQYPVQLIVRDRPVNGLSGAVLHGMTLAHGDVFIVMDADLQHPPECLPALIAPILDNSADFALGSRYTRGGTIEGKWSLFRRLNSAVATLLARPIAPRVTDPMSGFFALPRHIFEQARDLTPRGYKIALELLVKTRAPRVIEVPIHFSMRLAGESKLSLKQQARYLRHLVSLYAWVAQIGFTRKPILHARSPSQHSTASIRKAA